MSTQMTSTDTTAAGPHLTFGGLLRSEWIKLRSLRSTLWCYLLMVVLTVGLGFLITATFSGEPLPEEGQQAVWVQVATLGINFTQLIVAVLGALVITGEFGTGMIRSTFAAAPQRIPALIAKALVFGVVTLIVSFVAVAGTALLAAPLLPSQDIHPDFGDPAVWLALLGGAGYLALLGVLCLAIGTIIRSSAGGIAASLGLILVVPVILQALAGITQTQWPLDVLTFLPSQAGAQMFAYPTGFPAPPDMIVLEPWQGALVLAGWTVGLLVVGAVLLKRRDA